MGVQKSRKNTRFFKANLIKYRVIKEIYRKNKKRVNFLLIKHEYKKSGLFKLINQRAVKPLFFDN